MAEKIDMERIERQIQEIKKTRRVHHGVAIGIVAVVGIVGLLLIAGMLMGSLKGPVGKAAECSTESCFIKAANRCWPAVYQTKIETVKLRFTTEDCELKKEVIAVEATEPESIQKLFKGAEMTCQYEEGKFDKRYIEQISYDILTCEGSLVDAVKKIL